MTEQDITGGLSQTLKPGSSIGSYVVQREIGRGGFGVVYEARHKDPSLNWRVAVKELFPQALVIRVNDTVICTNPNIKPVFDRILDKFVETTAILHNLEHRNIVRVRDLERAHGTAYMVMDYVEGVNFLTWRRNLGRQPTPEEIRQIFEPIFQAIAYMHGKGLLHRDISPLNIMIRDGGKSPMLIDFGTMKQFVEQETTQSEYTASMAICNRAYAAPEQLVQGSQQHGTFTDVYEAAASLYFALAGKPPVPAEARKDAVSLYQKPDPYEPIASVSQVEMRQAAYAAIDRALALVPERRTQTMEAFLADLGWSGAEPKALELAPGPALIARKGKDFRGLAAIVKGGQPPYRVLATGLPAGYTAAAEGSRIEISGVTLASGHYPYSLDVSDSAGEKATLFAQPLSIKEKSTLPLILTVAGIIVLLGTAGVVGIMMFPGSGECRSQVAAKEAIAGGIKSMQDFIQRCADTPSAEVQRVALELSRTVTKQNAIAQSDVGQIPKADTRQEVKGSPQSGSGDNDATAFNKSGIAHYNKGEYDAAIADFTKAIALSPTYEVAYINRGNAYDDKGDHDRAIADYTKAIGINPNSSSAYANRGLAYKRKGETDRAIIDYSKAIGFDPTNAFAYVARGTAFDEKGDYDKAITDYNRAIELNANDAVAYNNRGVAYRHKGDINRAISDYTAAIRLNPNYALAYNNRGEAYKDNGNRNQAISDFTKAISVNPNYALAYFNRGMAHKDNGNKDQALSDFTKAILLFPDYAAAYNARGNIYYDGGQRVLAIADYTKAIEIDPNYQDAYLNRGNAHDDNGDHDRAIADYNRALVLNPNDATAYYNRGLAFERKGAKAQAASDYRSALKLNPNEPDAAEALKRVTR